MRSQRGLKSAWTLALSGHVHHSTLNGKLRKHGWFLYAHSQGSDLTVLIINQLNFRFYIERIQKRNESKNHLSAYVMRLKIFYDGLSKCVAYVSANPVQFRGIRPRMYIDGSMWYIVTLTLYNVTLTSQKTLEHNNCVIAAKQTVIKMMLMFFNKILL